MSKAYSSLRILVLCLCANAINEYCRVGKSIAMEHTKRFCVTIHTKFDGLHLRNYRG
jgi:hypothetical protein